VAFLFKVSHCSGAKRATDHSLLLTAFFYAVAGFVAGRRPMPPMRIYGQL